MTVASEDIKKSSRGRPRADTTPVMVRIDAAELAAIDHWRRDQDDLPSRPEAVRRLMRQALSPKD